MAMRTLGIDYGERRVGLALSDPMGMMASPFRVIVRESDKQVVEETLRVIQEEDVTRVVLGHPIQLNGQVGRRAERVQKFAKLLEQSTNIPVVLFDERLTTVSAERVLLEADVRRKKRKQVVDSLAATIMLQNYLDARSH